MEKKKKKDVKCNSYNKEFICILYQHFSFKTSLVYHFPDVTPTICSSSWLQTSLHLESVCEIGRIAQWTPDTPIRKLGFQI